MRHRVLLLTALAAVAASIVGPVASAPASPPSLVGDALGVCEPLDPAHCLLPFPSDHFTVADPTTATGRRVSFHPTALPANVAGKPWDPTEWNRNDGFSPGTPILAMVPGLDLRRTWGIDDDQLSDLSRSLDADAPIVLLDATTGERHPFWSELDTHPDTADPQRLLVIRPARNLGNGHRYVVALRGLRRADGSAIAPTGPTARDAVMADLAAAGVATDGLFVAWDFTVASEANLTQRVLHMRDEAFAGLGDTDLADGRVDGAAPRVTITSVTDFTPEESRATARTVRGTVTVPNYLTPQYEIDVEVEALGESASQAIPGSRLLYGADGLPERDPLQPSVEVEFECHLPRSATPSTPADGLVYGHGLLGSRGESGGGSTEDLRLRGFAPCAMDWWGMSFSDVANVVSILLDMSSFPSLADRSQQGFLNMLFLARALAHPDGLAALPAFQDAAGQPLIRPGTVVYAGNSQGAIMGGALTALAPDFTRAVLGVAGMNYSTLLNRSVDWEGLYAEAAYAAYPSKLEQQLLFALIQMVWDRAEADGYANQMTNDPLPGTPAHQVMLQVAYSDHQVANVTAEVEARTIGARLVAPGFGPANPHWSVDPAFGLATASFGPASVGESVLVYWYSSERGLSVPPNGNVPASVGEDPHDDPRKENRASDQVAHWLRTGELLDVCAGAVCETTAAGRSND